jgi:hypothetical protein
MDLFLDQLLHAATWRAVRALSIYLAEGIIEVVERRQQAVETAARLRSRLRSREPIWRSRSREPGAYLEDKEGEGS